MRYCVSHYKLNLNLSAQGLKPGDAGEFVGVRYCPFDIPTLAKGKTPFFRCGCSRHAREAPGCARV